MLLNLIRSGGDSLTFIIGLCSGIFVVFCTMPIHEFAHALIATKLGDDTPRLSGRLTLSPLAHIDWLGALMILFVGFGYAKPVQVNIRNFKHKKLYMAITALAGPFANIIMANLFMLLHNYFIVLQYNGNSSTLVFVCTTFFYYASFINVSLAVFNILPIPPLDGSRIATMLIPKKYYFKIMQYERYIILVIFALIFLGVLDRPLTALTSIFMKAISAVTYLPFKNMV